MVHDEEEGGIAGWLQGGRQLGCLVRKKRWLFCLGCDEVTNEWCRRLVLFGCKDSMGEDVGDRVCVRICEGINSVKL